MKKLTSQDLSLCKLQGQLFERSAQSCACSSAVFVRRFMNSRLALSFDDGSLLYESYTVEAMLAELSGQYGPSSYGSNKYGAESLYWMGYLYRYWCVAFGLSSKAVYRIIPARELNELFGAYHTLDPVQAIERIYEAKELPQPLEKPSNGYVEEGVALLRAMHERSSYEYFAISF